MIDVFSVQPITYTSVLRAQSVCHRMESYVKLESYKRIVAFLNRVCEVNIVQPRMTHHPRAT